MPSWGLFSSLGPFLSKAHDSADFDCADFWRRVRCLQSAFGRAEETEIKNWPNSAAVAHAAKREAQHHARGEGDSPHTINEDPTWEAWPQLSLEPSQQASASGLPYPTTCHDPDRECDLSQPLALSRVNVAVICRSHDSLPVGTLPAQANDRSSLGPAPEPSRPNKDRYIDAKARASPRESPFGL
jgi:hypothetical protein